MKLLFKNAFIKVACLILFIAVAFNTNAQYNAASGNLALGKTITPSAFSAIIDGNTATSWTSYTGTFPLPITFTINLGANINISSIRMYCGGIKNYKIEGSGGQVITNLLTESNSDAEFTISTPMTTTFVKFTILSVTSAVGTRPISIGELGIFPSIPCPGSPAVCTSSLTVGGQSSFVGSVNVLGLSSFIGNVNVAGNVLINKTSQANSTYKLDVEGTVRAKEIVVNTTGMDIVFEDNYKLRSLEEVESFIKENKHLPEIASAAEMQKDGVGISQLQTQLLGKVEELTLYLIELKKENKELVQKNKELSNRISKLETN